MSIPYCQTPCVIAPLLDPFYDHLGNPYKYHPYLEKKILDKDCSNFMGYSLVDIRSDGSLHVLFHIHTLHLASNNYFVL